MNKQGGGNQGPFQERFVAHVLCVYSRFCVVAYIPLYFSFMQIIGLLSKYDFAAFSTGIHGSRCSLFLMMFNINQLKISLIASACSPTYCLILAIVHTDFHLTKDAYCSLYWCLFFDIKLLQDNLQLSSEILSLMFKRKGFVICMDLFTATP